MIKKIAWDTFKKTGNIDTFMEYKQIENIENNIKEIQNITNLNLKDNNKKQRNKHMANVKTNGIIIAEHNLGDFDKMLTILTPGFRQNFLCCQGGEET